MLHDRSGLRADVIDHTSRNFGHDIKAELLGLMLVSVALPFFVSVSTLLSSHSLYWAHGPRIFVLFVPKTAKDQTVSAPDLSQPINLANLLML